MEAQPNRGAEKVGSSDSLVGPTIEALDLAVPLSKRVTADQRSVHVWQFFDSDFMKLTLTDECDGRAKEKLQSTPSRALADRRPVRASPAPSPRARKNPPDEPSASGANRGPADRRPLGRRPVGIVVDDARAEVAADVPVEQQAAAVVASHHPFGRRALWRRSKKFARNCVARAARKVGLGSARAE